MDLKVNTSSSSHGRNNNAPPQHSLSDMCKVLSLPCFPAGRAEQSAVIGVNVFKFSLQLSGRFILPVVTANGCITTGSGPEAPEAAAEWVGEGHLCRLKGEADPPCQP